MSATIFKNNESNFISDGRSRFFLVQLGEEKIRRCLGVDKGLFMDGDYTICFKIDGRIVEILTIEVRCDGFDRLLVRLLDFGTNDPGSRPEGQFLK